MDKINTFSEKELAKPECGERQVLVRMKAVGVCGSDVHYWKNGRIGQFVVEEPLILGHECSGVITDVGEKVSKFAVGDRVVLEPGIPCMKCEHCLKGRYNLCQNIVFFATPPDDGVLVEEIAYDEDYVFKIPDEVTDYGLATMAEPLSVGLFATQRIKPALGEKAIIFGAGIIGITCLLAAKAAGCKDITVADIRDDRLACAKEMGADQVVNTMKDQIPDNTFDFGYEATGADACYNLAVKCIKPGGRIAMIGMGPEIQKVDMVDYVCKEITIVPSFRYSNTYPLVLDLLKDNQEKLKQLITHRVPFSLEGVEEAFHIASEDPSAVKVVVEF
nr:NAD(P)-dependent alcohol dehydrogenase [[Clostridium] scindens]